MRKIDPAEYQKRLDRMTELFSGMVQKASESALNRCPYRNRHDDCTAEFRCRNQRAARAGVTAPQCGHDGKFDYRSAWESDPDALGRARQRVARIKAEAAAQRGSGRRKAPER
ncbi:MAG: hypothetical protein AB7P52_17885 [Alphaproteobacteria bacterium]